MVSKSKRMPKAAEKKPAAKKASAKPAEKRLNMGLGRLKGVFQERKSRLDAEIERQSGGRKRK